MVITLKSGVQIRADVESFSTGAAAVSGELRNLKWAATDHPAVKITWVDVGEIAAVHGECEPGDAALEQPQEATART
jgi:hypothetical protein